MSDIKVAGIFSWANAGPLTATWSAAASCETSGGPVVKGPASPSFNNTPQMIIGPCDDPTRGIPSEECIPNGDKVKEIYEGEDWRYQTTLSHYYSATACPQGWASVGHAAINNGTPTSTGIFAPTVFYDGSPTQTTDHPYGNWIANMFTTILEPTETAIACCPSGFSADMYAGCYSNFPLSELAGSTACRIRYQPTGDTNNRDNFYTETWVYDGVTTTQTARAPPFTSGWRDSDEAVTESVPFDSDGLPAPTGSAFQNPPAYTFFETAVARAMPMFLVNNAGSDGSEQPAESTGTGSEAPAAPSGTGTEESAARALAPGSWGMVGGVMAAWGISMIAGVGLLAAW